VHLSTISEDLASPVSARFEPVRHSDEPLAAGSSMIRETMALQFRVLTSRHCLPVLNPPYPLPARNPPLRLAHPVVVHPSCRHHERTEGGRRLRTVGGCE